MAEFYGFNPPFIGGVQNVLSRQEDIRLIKNDILQLLLTIPGERVMRPDFGVNLRNFVFEPMINADLTTLRGEIATQITKWDKRVTVDLIEINPDPDSQRVDITVHARLKKDPTREVNVELFINSVQ
jgi:phage baseplate assembly protein W